MHAKEIYKEACNSAEEQYGEEDRAHRVAWSAVEQKYEKNEMGEWVSKQDRYRPASPRRFCEVRKGWRA